MDIADKLKMTLEKLGVNHDTLADLLGVPVGNLRNWLYRHREPRGLAAEALNEKLDRIMPAKPIPKKRRKKRA